MRSAMEEKVVFSNPEEIKYPEKVKLFFMNSDWITPALYLADNIKRKKFVRLIGESFYTDYLQVIVVLEDDPEEILDEIFSIEEKMRKQFNNVNFDIRVRVISNGESVENIRKNFIIRYERI